MFVKKLFIVGLFTSLVAFLGCSNVQTQGVVQEESAIVVPEVEKTEKVVVEPVYENRVVTEEKGIFVRNTEGDKIRAVAKGTEILMSRRLEVNEIPEKIAGNAALLKYEWAIGDIGAQTVIFAQDFTSIK